MTATNATGPCILCNRSLRLIGEDFTGKEIFHCADCDYVMTPPSPPEENTEIYDDPEYFDGWGSNMQFDYDRFEPEVHRQVSEYLEFIAKHAPGQSLLDVGTGSGLLPHLARERGYDVEGTDLSKHVSDTLPAKSGLTVHHGALEDIQFTHRYDIITMLHVLEHTLNPLSTMIRARELLNEGGSIIVVVPNYRSLDTRIKDLLSQTKLKSRPYKHLALGHHNFVFSTKSLEILGRKAGLKVVHCETRQPAARAGGLHGLLGRFEAGAWCWMVYQSASVASQ
jgi:2-polyprenyl-3-methyl-5-hydroxy-6-metoxy-1,4-benzoquinol methylase